MLQQQFYMHIFKHEIDASNKKETIRNVHPLQYEKYDRRAAQDIRT
jgi:hypothetical protein